MRKRYDIYYETITTRWCPKCWTTNVKNYEMNRDDLFVCLKCHSKFQYNYDREDIWDWNRCFEFLPS